MSLGCSCSVACISVNCWLSAFTASRARRSMSSTSRSATVACLSSMSWRTCVRETRYMPMTTSWGTSASRRARTAWCSSTLAFISARPGRWSASASCLEKALTYSSGTSWMCSWCFSKSARKSDSGSVDRLSASVIFSLAATTCASSAATVGSSPSSSADLPKDRSKGSRGRSPWSACTASSTSRAGTVTKKSVLVEKKTSLAWHTRSTTKSGASLSTSGSSA
mmetsp:Transcript_4299/g.12390  ORF Transcript_4299/g.12390 Transcript_4299/m.12390 type:complete len:223 (+) Transcript_4299:1168-1836(+)